MTLRFVDGFDHYSSNADLNTKWNDLGSTTVTVSTSSGRRGGGCIATSSSFSLTKTFDSQQIWVVGMALKLSPNLGNSDIIRLNDEATIQVNLRVNLDNTLSVLRNGSTVLATSTNALRMGAWNYIEFKAKIDPTTGTYDVHVNGESWISGSGANTRANSNSSACDVQIVETSNFLSPGCSYDDIYICDGQGSTNNTFLGDVRVDTLFPNGAGNSTQLTASAGSNYQCVDDNPENGDTDYVSSATASQKDTYAFQDITHTPNSFFGAQINMWTRTDDSGTRAICAVTRSGGSDTDGATQYIGTGYQNLIEIRETDPNTSAAWTKTNFNAAEFGVKIAV